jgi:glycosyltransferase involved in cell wall biosynthesis
MLVALRDTEAAARVLVQLAADPELRKRLGQAARKRFQDGYTEDSVRRAVRTAYAAFCL